MPQQFFLPILHPCIIDESCSRFFQVIQINPKLLKLKVKAVHHRLETLMCWDTYRHIKDSFTWYHRRQHRISIGTSINLFQFSMLYPGLTHSSTMVVVYRMDRFSVDYVPSLDPYRLRYTSHQHMTSLPHQCQDFCWLLYTQQIPIHPYHRESISHARDVTFLSSHHLPALR